MNSPFVVFITGPTACGKSSLAHKLFRKGDLIINADSRQVYKYFNIGTGKPTRAELQQYSYALIDYLDPTDSYSVHKFYKDFFEIITRHTGGRIFVTGGTTFYLDVLKYGLPPEYSRDVTSDDYYRTLYKEKGLGFLLSELEERDPDYYAVVDRHNHRRIIRALEHIRMTNQTFSEYRLRRSSPGLNILTIVLHRDRDDLYRRINERVDLMVERGLVEEVSSLCQKYGDEVQPLTGIGYREFIPYFKKKISLDEAIFEVKKDTRRFAKQQLTSLKKFKDSIYCSLTERSDEQSIDDKDKWFYDKIKINVALFGDSTCIKDYYSGRVSSVENSDFIERVINKFYEEQLFKNSNNGRWPR